jgi:hypothetical protein
MRRTKKELDEERRRLGILPPEVVEEEIEAELSEEDVVFGQPGAREA